MESPEPKPKLWNIFQYCFIFAVVGEGDCSRQRLTLNEYINQLIQYSFNYILKCRWFLTSSRNFVVNDFTWIPAGLKCRWLAACCKVNTDFTNRKCDATPVLSYIILWHAFCRYKILNIVKVFFFSIGNSRPFLRFFIHFWFFLSFSS